MEFTPAVADATTSGSYVYTLDLKEAAYPEGEQQNPGETFCMGTMTIEWKMLIDRNEHSQNDFYALYEGTVTARYNSDTGKIIGGIAKGTAKTTDTFISDGFSDPHVTNADFEWTFTTP